MAFSDSGRRTPVAAILALVVLASVLVGLRAAAPSEAAPGCPTAGSGTGRGVVDVEGLEEASGLAASRANPGVVWAHADSGAAARLYALDVTDGQLIASFDLTGVTNVDWEDLAVGPGPGPSESYLYVGDIGGNASSRADVVYRVPEPAVGPAAGPGPHALAGAVPIPFSYPGVPRDAESLLVDPVSGDLFIVAKPNPSDLSQVLSPTPVFRVPAPHDGTPVTLEQVRTLDFSAPPLAGSTPASLLPTGGDISASGEEIIIRTYATAFVWRRGPTETVAEALRDAPCPVPLQPEPQGEAIAFSADGTGYVTLSEQPNDNQPQPLYHHPILTRCSHAMTDVPAWVDTAVDWIVCEGHATGYEDGTFRPYDTITRAATARMLFRIAGSPDPGAGCRGLTDVPSWARDGICWLVNNDYATGYDDLTFRPYETITRAATARMLYRIYA